MPATLSLKKKLLFSSFVFLIFYGLIECVATTVAWYSWWDTSFWLYEDSGRTWRFDPIRGHRLSRTPSRFLRSTNGRLEYVGTARGNSQGFPDRDDFGPKRPVEGRRRIAVFGDSFTEAQYLGQNWPDRAEDLARGRGEPVELLSMAISGGGLAYWWSILARLVDAEDYELDGVIFDVFAGDLRRKFTVWDHREADHPLLGRIKAGTRPLTPRPLTRPGASSSRTPAPSSRPKTSSARSRGAGRRESLDGSGRSS